MIVWLALIPFNDNTHANPRNHKITVPIVTKKYPTETYKILFVALKNSAVASITAIATLICFHSLHKITLKMMKAVNMATAPIANMFLSWIVLVSLLVYRSSPEAAAAPPSEISIIEIEIRAKRAAALLMRKMNIMEYTKPMIKQVNTAD